MNILFCSAGRRCELIKNFKESMCEGSKIIVTDMSNTAPALYVADKYYIVPPIKSEEYLDVLIDICKKENIQVITTLIDPEIKILSKNRNAFEKMGIKVLAPFMETAEICFDKYVMFKFLQEKGINTVQTYSEIDNFYKAYKNKEIDFPVFVKPRVGSGSVGARKIDNIEELKTAINSDPSLIIQEFMDNAIDIDVDIYVDMITKEPVSLFSKRKLETKIGGANKTISFKDKKLLEFVLDSLKYFEFYGAIDMDLWYRDGKYYLSEVNPRFGGAYIHAYGAGVDFIKLIENNVKGIKNEPLFNNYEEDIVMMMYDSAIIRTLDL